MTENVRIGGFTLIEMSIVLIVIGLIVGGVLVGQNLISAAEVRAQITQIDQYNTAVTAFEYKFDHLPGDMSALAARQFGFVVGTGCDGSIPGNLDRNDDGLVDGAAAPGSGHQGDVFLGVGETELFWQDLSSPVAGGLIDGTFPNGSAPPVLCGNVTNAQALSPTQIGEYLPPAKIGHNNYVYAYAQTAAVYVPAPVGNWFGLSGVSSFGTMMFNPTLIPARQAYAIDQKVDDGLPLSGSVWAMYVVALVPTLAPSASTDNATSCFNSSTNAYSTTYNNGAGGNCALSFRFQ